MLQDEKGSAVTPDEVVDVRMGLMSPGEDIVASAMSLPGSSLQDDASSVTDDISQMSSMVCEFELDSGFKKRVVFSPTYFSLVISFLGLMLKDGQLFCDPDEHFCEPPPVGFGFPPVSKVIGYKSMKLFMQFLDDSECELELTPLQTLVIVLGFEFKCDEASGIFTCISDEKAEKKFLRNPEYMAQLRAEEE